MKRSLNLWLILLVAVCGMSLWFGGDLFRRDGAERSTPVVIPAPEEAPRSVPVPAPEPVMISVMNGTSVPGLAGEFSLLLTRLGCTAADVGNAPHDGFTECLLVNRRLPRDRIHELRDLLGDVTVITEFDDRCPEDAVLVLGADADRLRVRLERTIRRADEARRKARN